MNTTKKRQLLGLLKEYKLIEASDSYSLKGSINVQANVPVQMIVRDSLEDNCASIVLKAKNKNFQQAAWAQLFSYLSKKGYSKKPMWLGEDTYRLEGVTDLHTLQLIVKDFLRR